MLNELVGVPLRIFLPIFVPALAVALFLIERWSG
jgi:hypothetical protein